MTTMTRKDFLRSVIGLGVGTAGIAALAACGGDDGGGGTPDAPAATCTSVTAVIDTNHGHTITVPTADVTAGTNRTYMIQGTSPHPHSVTINASQFAMLAAGQTLNVESTSGGGHTHTVTVMCA